MAWREAPTSLHRYVTGARVHSATSWAAEPTSTRTASIWLTVLEGDMVGTHFFGTWQYSPKISAGIVLKF